MGAIDDWYDDADRSADTALPYVVPFEIGGAATSVVSTEFYDEPQQRLDMSRVPPKNAGLPIDVDLANILAGSDGLASKPDAIAISLGFVEDLRSLANAILATFQGNLSAVPEWLAAHSPEWLGDFSGWVMSIGADWDQLFNAMKGDYVGENPILLQIQNLFAPIRKLLEVASGVVGGIGATAAQVGAFWDDMQSVLSGGTAAGSWFSGVLDFGGITTRLDDVEAAIADLGDIEAATPVTPAFVADIQDMATAPRFALTSLSTNTAGSMSCGDGAHSHTGHTHSMDVVMPTYKPDSTFTIGTATSYVDYTPIVVDRAGTVEKLRWIVGADASIFSINAYYMALCVYNPATGNVEKVWDSGDIKSGVADTSTLQEVEIDMGIDQECAPGQILFVAHMQLAPGALQSSRSFAAVPQAGIARPSTLLLDASSYRSPSRQTSIPSSISFASLTRVNSRIPWAAVSVDTEGS